MASRSISAILWTLVSVNFFTLIVGGLITWLGYTIPVRLQQAGLLPELVIAAGSASLVVACLGLCALNYSSANVLNIYACSCGLFILMLVLGIPDAWYKSTHFIRGTLLLDIIYFSLLFLLLLLFVFALTLAHYMRRKELQLGLNSQDFDSHSFGLAPQARQQQLLQQWHSQPVKGQRASRAGGCTCVMITPPTDDGGDDNNNQNILTAAAERNWLKPRTGSIIDRWFSRLKPSQGQPQTQTRTRTQIQAQLLAQTGQQTDGRLLDTTDHYLAAALAAQQQQQQQQQQQIRAKAHRRSSSALAYSSNQPYQSSSSGNYQPQPSCCSCGQVSPLQQTGGDTCSLAPLVSRGIYHQLGQQPPEPLEHDRTATAAGLCRSAGNLCTTSDEQLVEWPQFERHHDDDYDDDEGDSHEFEGLLSQDDTSVRYADAAGDGGGGGGGGGWMQQPVQQRWRPRTQQTSTRYDTYHYRPRQYLKKKQQHRVGNANYSHRPAAATECNCPTSMSHKQQQSPYTLPMINSSSSVYSISGQRPLRAPSFRQQTTKAHSSSSVVAMTAAAAAAAIFGGGAMDTLDLRQPAFYGASYNNNGLEESALIDVGNCNAAVAVDNFDYG